MVKLGLNFDLKVACKVGGFFFSGAGMGTVRWTCSQFRGLVVLHATENVWECRYFCLHEPVSRLCTFSNNIVFLFFFLRFTYKSVSNRHHPK